MHLGADEIAVRPEHFVLVQEELDFETFQAVRQITLSHDVLLKLQNEALFELLSEHRNAVVAVGLLPLGCEGIPYIFSEEDISAGVRLTTPSHNPVEKKSCGTVRDLSPTIVFVLLYIRSFLGALQKTKRQTPRKEVRKESLSPSQHIHRHILTLHI